MLIASGESLRIHCDYCRALYELSTDDFARILHDGASE
jgi:hypothetical protein